MLPATLEPPGTLPAFGTWRSLVAHLLWEQGVAGSNPVVPMTRISVPERRSRDGRRSAAGLRIGRSTIPVHQTAPEGSVGAHSATRRWIYAVAAIASVDAGTSERRGSLVKRHAAKLRKAVVRHSIAMIAASGVR